MRRTMFIVEIVGIQRIQATSVNGRPTPALAPGAVANLSSIC
jgi:hypothetical protein